MCELNKKSDMYFVVKEVGFKPLNIAKIHLVDDNCNEFIVTINQAICHLGYIGINDITIIDYEIYTAEKWETMTKYLEYEKAHTIG